MFTGIYCVSIGKSVHICITLRKIFHNKINFQCMYFVLCTLWMRSIIINVYRFFNRYNCTTYFYARCKIIICIGITWAKNTILFILIHQKRIIGLFYLYSSHKDVFGFEFIRCNCINDREIMCCFRPLLLKQSKGQKYFYGHFYNPLALLIHH